MKKMVVVSLVLCFVGLPVSASADNQTEPIKILSVTSFKPMPNDSKIANRMVRVVIENHIANNFIRVSCDGTTVSVASEKKIERIERKGIFEKLFFFYLPGKDSGQGIGEPDIYRCQATLVRGDNQTFHSNSMATTVPARR